MNYTITVNEVKSENGLKGFATVVFQDCFKITNITIREKAGSGALFVSMPRYKTVGENEEEIYQDVCNPITGEFRNQLYEDIIDAYKSPGRRLIRESDTPLKDEMPQFTVKVVPYSQEGSNIIGFARIYLEDSFVINNVTILKGKESEFVSMPSYKTKEMDDNNKPIYRDICYPVTKEFREKLYTELISECEKQLKKSKEINPETGKLYNRREQIQKEEQEKAEKAQTAKQTKKDKKVR